MSELTLEEMKAQVEAAEAAEAEAEAEALVLLNKPYNDFATSEDLTNFRQTVAELREYYINKDDRKFRTLEALHRILQSL